VVRAEELKTVLTVYGEPKEAVETASGHSHPFTPG